MHRVFFTSIDSTTPIWELSVPNIELAAGMLAVGMGIMDDLNVSGTKYYVDSDADVSEFRLLSDIPEESLRSNSLGKLQPGQYGIWLKGSKRFHYNLFAFQTNSFFQGVVSAANAFEVDFRNYIYGFPFDFQGKLFSLSGYVMAPNQVAVDAPDIDDIEEEEEWDENINSPLARTDDIITVTDSYIATPDGITYTN